LFSSSAWEHTFPKLRFERTNFDVRRAALARSRASLKGIPKQSLRLSGNSELKNVELWGIDK